LTYTELIADSASFIDLYETELLETYVGFIPIAVPEVVFSYGCLPLPLSKQKQLVDAGLKVLSSDLDLEELSRLREANPVVGMVDCIALYEANQNLNFAVLTDNHWILDAAANENIQTASYTYLQRQVASKQLKAQRRRRWSRTSGEYPSL